MTDYTLKCLQYIAFHREKVDILGEMSISEGLKVIEPRIAKATFDNIEDVKSGAYIFKNSKTL